MANQDLPLIAKFAVRRRAYITPDGTLLRDLPDFASDQELVVSLYRAMVCRYSAPAGSVPMPHR
jgi:hypothetical protein